jgi:hypothetical protein
MFWRREHMIGAVVAWLYVQSHTQINFGRQMTFSNFKTAGDLGLSFPLRRFQSMIAMADPTWATSFWRPPLGDPSWATHRQSVNRAIKH